MGKFKKCESLQEEARKTTCIDQNETCPKHRAKHRVTATCWKVPDVIISGPASETP